MSYLIIAFVVLSLMGSVMWVMPTKRDRMLSELRMQAKKLGYQVQLTKLTLPREKKQVEPRGISTVAYRLLRGKIDLSLHNSWKSWRVARCETNANEGLLPGWGWIVGERLLEQAQIEQINDILSVLPEDVLGLESTPIHTSVFWGETKAEDLELITAQLNKMKANKI